MRTISIDNILTAYSKRPSTNMQTGAEISWHPMKNIISSEIASPTPQLHLMDFVSEAEKDREDICIILECQSNLANDDDITRFFRYVSYLRNSRIAKWSYTFSVQKRHPTQKRNTLSMMNV